MAGPWFTVHEPGKWQTLDLIWVSNGEKNLRATLEMRVELREPNHE